MIEYMFRVVVRYKDGEYETYPWGDMEYMDHVEVIVREGRKQFSHIYDIWIQVAYADK